MQKSIAFLLAASLLLSACAGSTPAIFESNASEIRNVRGMSTAEEINAYTAGDEAVHHTVTLRRESDGRLTIQSHHIVLGGTDLGKQ